MTCFYDFIAQQGFNEKDVCAGLNSLCQLFFSDIQAFQKSTNKKGISKVTAISKAQKTQFLKYA